MDILKIKSKVYGKGALKPKKSPEPVWMKGTKAFLVDRERERFVLSKDLLTELAIGQNDRITFYNTEDVEDSIDICIGVFEGIITPENKKETIRITHSNKRGLYKGGSVTRNKVLLECFGGEDLPDGLYVFNKREGDKLVLSFDKQEELQEGEYSDDLALFRIAKAVEDVRELGKKDRPSPTFFTYHNPVEPKAVPMQEDASMTYTFSTEDEPKAVVPNPRVGKDMEYYETGLDGVRFNTMPEEELPDVQAVDFN